MEIWQQGFLSLLHSLLPPSRLIKHIHSTSQRQNLLETSKPGDGEDKNITFEVEWQSKRFYSPTPVLILDEIPHWSALLPVFPFCLQEIKRKVWLSTHMHTGNNEVWSTQMLGAMTVQNSFTWSKRHLAWCRENPAAKSEGSDGLCLWSSLERNKNVQMKSVAYMLQV